MITPLFQLSCISMDKIMHCPILLRWSLEISIHHLFLEFPHRSPELVPPREQKFQQKNIERSTEITRTGYIRQKSDVEYQKFNFSFFDIFSIYTPHFGAIWHNVYTLVFLAYNRIFKPYRSPELDLKTIPYDSQRFSNNVQWGIFLFDTAFTTL